MNDGSTIRDRGRNREEVELFCYKVLTLLVKWYSVICKWAWISSECIL